MTAPHLPGRLGDPDRTIATDPRADPRMVAVMLPLGMADRTPPQPVTVDSPLETLHEFNVMAEAGFEMMFSMTSGDLGPVVGVERTIEVIRGVDGNDITLYIHRPGRPTHRPVARRAAPPRRRHGHARSRRGRAISGGATSWPQTGLVVVRRRVPQRRRQARTPSRSRPASTTARRPCCGSADNAPAPGRLQDRGVGRVRRWQPDAGHHPEGQARRQARR